jgi:hypothetical protein
MLEYLPVDLLLSIFSYLPLSSLLSLTRTSRCISDVLENNDSIWLPLFPLSFFERRLTKGSLKNHLLDSYYKGDYISYSQSMRSPLHYHSVLILFHCPLFWIFLLIFLESTGTTKMSIRIDEGECTLYVDDQPLYQLGMNEE